MGTIQGLRRILKSRHCRYVFVNVIFNSDDVCYVETTKAAILRAFAGSPRNMPVDFVVRDNETDAVYIG